MIKEIHKKNKELINHFIKKARNHIILEIDDLHEVNSVTIQHKKFRKEIVILNKEKSREFKDDVLRIWNSLDWVSYDDASFLVANKYFNMLT